jgi:hypothetical protein
MTTEPITIYNECPICYDSNDLIQLTSCRHYIHEMCIERHFRQECSVCRTPQFDVYVKGESVHISGSPNYNIPIETEGRDINIMSDDEDTPYSDSSDDESDFIHYVNYKSIINHVSARSTNMSYIMSPSRRY